MTSSACVVVILAFVTASTASCSGEKMSLESMLNTYKDDFCKKIGTEIGKGEGYVLVDKSGETRAMVHGITQGLRKAASDAYNQLMAKVEHVMGPKLDPIETSRICTDKITKQCDDVRTQVIEKRFDVSAAECERLCGEESDSNSVTASEEALTASEEAYCDKCVPFEPIDFYLEFQCELLYNLFKPGPIARVRDKCHGVEKTAQQYREELGL